MFAGQRLPTFLCFSVFLLLSIICANATEIYSSEDQLPLTDDYKFHRRPAHGISDPGSPWITGPKNKKYQFHVGRQSWLAAREHCLGQNSDLVTISSQEELEWILGHYSPQFPNLKDRLIQIGLLIDTNYGTREWRWVNKSPLSHDILSWVTGEPFDHADGRERCAILRVNEKSLDDVDCDLPGSMTMMYRFVCERTHEEHVKHEEVNNPLWKKLQDILDFFGISGGQEESSTEKNTTKSDETEDYWEMSKKNATTPSENGTTKSETEEVIVSSTISQASQSEDIEGSGVDVEVTSSSIAPPQAQGAKTLDKALISDELLLNENLAKINDKSAENKATTSTGDVVLLETASIETTRTTKADPLEKISANKDKSHMEDAYVDVLERNMEKLEKIVSAVEKMIDPMEEDLEEPTPPKPKIIKEGIIKKENKHKQEELKRALDDDNQANKIINDEQTSNTTKKTENENGEAKDNEKDTVDAMENDFDEAEHETQEHPNVNSGDLVVTPEHQENIELCENENDEEAKEEEKKSEKIEKFLKTLHRFLNRSSAKDLKELVEESKQNGTSLLERLNQSISKATETQMNKLEKIQQTLNESSVVSNAKDDDDEKNVKKSRENDISKISVVLNDDDKGHNKVQFSSVENNNNNNTDENVASTTTVITPSMSTTSPTTSTTPEKTTTKENENEKTSSNISETEENSTTKNEFPTNNNDEINKNNNATSVEKDEKESSSNKKLETAAAADLKQGSTTKSAEKIEANPDENGEENIKKEEDKSHEVTLTIHLPKEEKTDKTEKESAMNNDVEEKMENKKSLEEEKIENNKVEASEKEEEKEDEEEKSNEIHDIKIEPKSRADRLFSKTDTSVFPTPRFDLLKPEDLKKIPDDINKALEKEAKKISKIYDDFNKRIDTASLIKRIEESEKRRLEELKPLLPLVTFAPPPPLPKVTLAPSHDEAEKKAMRELEKLFEDLGKNFQQIVQG